MHAALLALHLVLAATDPYETGLDHYRDADYYGAADAFQKALKLPRTPEREAKAWVWLGLSMFNLGDFDSARADFRSGLLIDREVSLPDEAPPKAAPIFEEVRREVRALPPAAKPKAKPLAEARPEPKPEAVAAVEAPAAEVRGEPSGPKLKPWMGYAVGGLGVGLGIAAGGLRYSAGSNFDQAAAEPRAVEAARLNTRADSQQHAALYLGVAAATTLAAGAVIYLLANL